MGGIVRYLIKKPLFIEPASGVILVNVIAEINHEQPFRLLTSDLFYDIRKKLMTSKKLDGVRKNSITSEKNLTSSCVNDVKILKI